MNEHIEQVKNEIRTFSEDEYFGFVNLHIHSKYSDGSAEFEDIIRQARDLGFRKIAICDHNTVEGHKKFHDNILMPAVECFYAPISIWDRCTQSCYEQVYGKIKTWY